MKTISILNMKGGVGKSTTSYTLARGLSSLHNKKVLLIDLDAQANTTDMFLDEDILLQENFVSVNDLLFDQSLISDAIIKINDCLDLIPATLDLINADVKLKMGLGIQHTRLSKALRTVKNDYDYCIIDCPPILNVITVNAILCSSEVIVPVKCDRMAYKGFSLTYNNIQQIKDDYDCDNIHVNVLFTLLNRNGISAEKQQQIIKFLACLNDADHYKTSIHNQGKPIDDALEKRKCVIETDPKSTVGKDYLAFIDEFLKKESEGL